MITSSSDPRPAICCADERQARTSALLAATALFAQRLEALERGAPEGAAAAALHRHVASAQCRFAACVREAHAALAMPSSMAASASGAWGYRIGDLDLTAVWQQKQRIFREHRAARAIQKAWRMHGWKAEERVREGARRERAARTLQRAVRRFLKVKRMNKERQRRQARAAAETARYKRGCVAARTIQVSCCLCLAAALAAPSPSQNCPARCRGAGANIEL